MAGRGEGGVCQPQGYCNHISRDLLIYEAVSYSCSAWAIHHSLAVLFWPATVTQLRSAIAEYVIIRWSSVI